MIEELSELELHYLNASIAIEDDDLEKLKKEVQEYPKCLEYSNSSEGTLLHWAAYNGNPKMIEFLVQSGADINRVEDECTPIVCATMEDKIDNVQMLLQLDAILDSENSVENPLIAAIVNNNEEIAKLLIDSGIDLTIQYSTRDDDWWDVLSYARYRGCDEIAEMILQKLEEDGIDYDSIVPLTDEDFEDEDEDIVYMEDYYAKKLGTIHAEYDEVDIQKKIYDGEIRLTSEIGLYIDVIMPDENRDYVTLVTTGMSEVAMAETDDGLKFAELMMKLPADWDVSLEEMNDSEKNWPFRMLLKTAHLGHKFPGSYVSEKVVIPSGNPNDAILCFDGETELSSVMLCKSEDIPPLKANEEVTIEFFTLIPITEAEAELVRNKGSEAVKQKLPKGELVDMEREYLV